MAAATTEHVHRVFVWSCLIAVVLVTVAGFALEAGNAWGYAVLTLVIVPFIVGGRLETGRWTGWF